MIVDPETEYYDLVGSGHVSLYKTSPVLADDLKKYFVRCKEKNIHPNKILEIGGKINKKLPKYQFMGMIYLKYRDFI